MDVNHHMHKNVYLLVHCVEGVSTMGIHRKVREQFVRVCSLPPPVDAGARTQVVRLDTNTFNG